MRGDKSALTKGILSPYASRPQIGGESRTFQSINTSPKTTKNFPTNTRHRTKRNRISPCTGRVSVGKFSGGQGGLEGLLRLQGFPHLSPSPFPFRRVVVCAARGTTPCAAYQKFRFCRIAGRRNASAKQVSARAPSNGRANDACRRLRGRRACTCGKVQISFEPPLRHRKPSMCQRTSRLLHRS